jgi:5-oxoprolinase (ATP-hydrolysing)
MRKVRIHKYAGVLSAYGLVLADVVEERQQPWMRPLETGTFQSIIETFKQLETDGSQKLYVDGFSAVDIHVERVLV